MVVFMAMLAYSRWKTGVSLFTFDWLIHHILYLEEVFVVITICLVLISLFGLLKLNFCVLLRKFSPFKWTEALYSLPSSCFWMFWNFTKVINSHKLVCSQFWPTLFLKMRLNTSISSHFYFVSLARVAEYRLARFAIWKNVPLVMSMILVDTIHHSLNLRNFSRFW